MDDIRQALLKFIKTERKYDSEPMKKVIARFDESNTTDVTCAIEKIMADRKVSTFLEATYLFINPHVEVICSYGNKKRFGGLRDGYMCKKSCACVREKFQSTMIDKYGAPHALQSDHGMTKLKSTLVSRYGSDTLHGAFKEDIERTNLRKYGTKTPLENSGIRNKAEKSLLKSHGVRRPFLSNDIQGKIGDAWEDINPDSQRSYVRTAHPDRTEAYSLMFDGDVSIISEPSKLNDELKRNTRKQVADMVGCSVSLVDKMVHDYGLREHYGESSYYERAVCALLDELSIPYRTGDRTIIKPKEIDIVIDSKKLGIEVNGLYWHSEDRGKKDRKYHIGKTNSANAAGYDLIHIFQDEWDNKPHIIKNIIKSRLGIYDARVYGRKCEAKLIDHSTAAKFLDDNHLQGASIGCFMNVGLYYGGMLLSVMTFKKSRGSIELSRFVNLGGYNIVGGASKLFKFAIKNMDQVCDIFTYSDRRYFTGDVYTAIGFSDDGVTSAGYFYFKRANKKYDRSNFQKHMLNDKLDVYDPSLSEWDNMKLNGFDRIWDCGHRKFLYKGRKI